MLCYLSDKNGGLWTSTIQGLNKMIPSKNENPPQRFFRYQSGQWIYPLYENNTGILWYGGIGGGVGKVIAENKKISRYASVGVTSIYEDEAGVLWLGSESGLRILHRKTDSLISYQHDPGDSNSLSYREVYAIYEEPNAINRTIWILCRGGGLDKMVFKNDNIVGLEKAEITHILPNPSDSMSLACKWGVTMYKDKMGNFWIGANKGLYQFDLESRKVTKFEYDSNRHINDRVEVIYQSPVDEENTLWIGTVNGLYRINLDGKMVTHYKHDPENYYSLSDNLIQAIVADPGSDGKIFWIGTYSGGLNKFNMEDGSCEHFTEKDGLPSNTIYSILIDDNSNIWLGTSMGLTKFNPKTQTFRTYDNSWAYYPGACLKSPKSGEMIFGEFVFHPDSMKDNLYAPQVILTDFKVFNRPIKLKKSITIIDEINLSHRQNFFSFEFAALDYTNPKKNQYAYMLEGIDDDWIHCGNRHYAYYADVKPGRYIFKVKGTNSDGVWNEQGTSVKIIISPPFWKTIWFQILALISLLGLLALSYYRHVSRLKRGTKAQQDFSKRLIEVGEQERKRIAGELHDSLGQNLLIAKNEIQQCLLSHPLPDECAENLKEISSIVTESINEAREISYNLHPHQLDRLGLKKAIESSIAKFSKSSDIIFVKEIDDIDDLFPKEKEIHIYRIIQEGLNNIVKHANAEQVDLKINHRKNLLEIFIEDNGIGFDYKKYSSDKVKTSGLGLAGIAERVKILEGDLNIVSAPKKGTRLNISIPIRGLKDGNRN